MTVRVLLLRHGPAGLRSAWQGEDADRPLTKHGIKKVERICRRLRKEGVEPDLVLTSPYLRCTMTADIVADALGGTQSTVVDEALAPGFEDRGLEPLLQRYPDASVMLVVGHEPDLSSVTHQVTGARVLLQKGGLVELELDRQAPRSATLVRLEQPVHLLR